MSLESPPPAPRGALVETWRFAKGQVSAGAATFVDWVLVSGSIGLGLHYLLAVPLGHIGGGLTDFAIKRHWVFDARSGAVRGQAWRYAVASLSSLAWNELLSWIAVSKFGLPKIPGVIGAAIFVGIAWNYPMHRLFVFRRAPQSSTEG